MTDPRQPDPERGGAEGGASARESEDLEIARRDADGAEVIADLDEIRGGSCYPNSNDPTHRQ